MASRNITFQIEYPALISSAEVREGVKEFIRSTYDISVPSSWDDSEVSVANETSVENLPRPANWR